jgi:hypothetical protein
MHLDVAAQIGEAIGGLAGVIALAWNIVVTARRSKAARAPDLRALLTQTVALMAEVIGKPQDYDWCRERLDSISRELNQLRPVLSRGVEHNVELLCMLLAHVQINGFRINDKDAPAADVARNSIKQQQVAQQALELANSIRRKWGDV